MIWRLIDDSPPKDGVTKIDLWTLFAGKGERQIDCVWKNGCWGQDRYNHDSEQCEFEPIDDRATHWMLSPSDPADVK